MENIKMVMRVNGGILTDQMMEGKFRYFIVAADGATDFQYTIAPDDTTVIVPGQAIEGGTGGVTTFEFYVGENEPVPLSSADRILRAISEKCIIAQIALIGTNQIHLAIESTDNGWNTHSVASSDTFSDAASNMEATVQALGVQGIPGTSGPVIPDNTNTGTTYDMSTVTISEVEFKLV